MRWPLELLRKKLIYSVATSLIVDSFNRTIQEHLKIKSSINHYSIIDSIYNELKIKKGIEWDAIMILFNIRNTNHNNGVYVDTKRKRQTFNYRNLSLSFIHQFPQNNSSEEIIVLITQDIINYLKIITSNSEIIELPLIKDISIVDAEKMKKFG